MPPTHDEVPAPSSVRALPGKVSADADEGRGAPTDMRDRAGLQRLAGVAGRDVLAVAQVDADVARPPHEVAGAGLGGGDVGAGVALGAGAARNTDAGLLEDRKSDGEGEGRG